MALSRTAIWGSVGLVTLAACVWLSTQSDDSAVAAKPPHKSRKLPGLASQFVDADFDSHFDKPNPVARNVFFPLIQVDTGAPKPDGGKIKDIYKIPATLASGDGEWIFTGYAEVDGESMGLLENTAKHQSGIIKTGENWKTSHVVRVTRESITLSGKDGQEQTVLRFDPVALGKQQKASAPAAPAPAASNQPVRIGPGLSGPIGPGMEMHPIRQFSSSQMVVGGG